jgi:hypothetical protein
MYFDVSSMREHESAKVRDAGAIGVVKPLASLATANKREELVPGDEGNVNGDELQQSVVI